jgi:hypothetical protein
VSLPPETIEVGKCYLNHVERGPRVLRVLALLPDGRIQYDYQNRYGTRLLSKWNASILDRAAFARMAERQVPCDWTPAEDG